MLELLIPSQFKFSFFLFFAYFLEKISFFPMSLKLKGLHFMFVLPLVIHNLLRLVFILPNLWNLSTPICISCIFPLSRTNTLTHTHSYLPLVVALCTLLWYICWCVYMYKISFQKTRDFPNLFSHSYYLIINSTF